MTGARLVASALVAALVAIGCSSSQSTGTTVGGGTQGGGDAGNAAVSCATAATLKAECCGAPGGGSKLPVKCAADWTSEQLCVDGPAKQQSIFTEPCAGLVASWELVNNVDVTKVFDAATGKLLALVSNVATRDDSCVAAGNAAEAIPFECLSKWATHDAPCAPKAANAYVSYCSANP